VTGAPRTVVLVGPPASGKTTVGRALAACLGLPFTDVDALVEARSGRSIPDVFATQGEAAFRALEADAVAEALAGGGVVALGGGAVETPAVRAALAGLPVVWLTVSRDVALARAAGGSRPLLAGDDPAAAWQRLVDAREQWYGGVATVRLDTTTQTPDALAQAVALELQERDA